LLQDQDLIKVEFRLEVAHYQQALSFGELLGQDLPALFVKSGIGLIQEQIVLAVAKGDAEQIGLLAALRELPERQIPILSGEICYQRMAL
jgi:hypothetical protein